MIRVRTFVLGPFEANGYLLETGNDGGWILIDPGYPEAELLAALRDRRDRPGLVLLTHGHFDHVAALPDVLAEHGSVTAVGIHPQDGAWFLDPANSWPPDYPPLDESRLRSADRAAVSEDRPIEFHGIRLRVIHTPGHTPGGVTYWAQEENLAFTGDTLFNGSIGRTDLYGGSMPELMRSLHRRLAPLPDDTVIRPGHGPASTMGRERETNPFMNMPVPGEPEET